MNPKLKKSRAAAAALMAQNGEAENAGAAVPSTPPPPPDPATPGGTDGNGDKGKGKGRKPGRPQRKIPVAQEFMQWIQWGDGLKVLRFWRDDWFYWPNEQTDFNAEWTGKRGVWYKLKPSSLKSIVNGWLQKMHPGDATPAMVKFILEYITCPECEINQERMIPCFLDGRAGGENWVVARNCNVDIMALAAGTPADKATEPHSPALFNLTLLEYDFDPAADCPIFKKYLAETFQDDADRETLQMMFGLCLTYDTSFEVFFILYGPPKTGKTTTTYILEKLLGSGACAALDVNELTEKHSKGDLAEKKVNIIGELPPTLGRAERGPITALLKKSASGQETKVEHKNKDPEYKKTTARIVACANVIPNFGDKTGAIHRRMIVIPFTKVVANEDPRLKEKLAAELPGILNWALEGWAKLRGKYGGKFPRLGGGAEIVASEQEDADPLGIWLRDNFEPCAGECNLVGQYVYDEYKYSLDEKSEKPLPRSTFYREVKNTFCLGPLKEAWIKENGMRKKVRVFNGLRRKIDLETLENEGVTLPPLHDPGLGFD